MEISKVLLSSAQIQEKVKKIGKSITEDFKDEVLYCGVIMNGAMIFASDLIREIKLELRVDFIQLQSYEQNGNVEIELIQDFTSSIKGQNVLLIDVLINTGTTLSHIIDYFICRQPKTISVSSLLIKEKPEKILGIKYKGFKVPDKYLIGYGLDFDQKYRNLPHIVTI